MLQDVLLFGGEDSILRRYASLHVPRDRVLFGAEHGCFPDWDLPFGQQFCTHGFPSGLGEYSYINSGIWMGRAGAAFTLLTDAIAYTPGRGVDDQQVISHLYVHQPSRFQLDRSAVLIQNMHLVPTRNNSVNSITNKSTNAIRLTNARTGTHPAMLHFNGGSKGEHCTFVPNRERLCHPHSLTWRVGSDTCTPHSSSFHFPYYWS